MLDLLRVKVDGFKMLEDGFTIDFTNKARVNQMDKETEIIEIKKNLYTFRTLAVVGKNSSGKSTVLSLILKVLIFLQTGRWEYLSRDFKKENIKLDLVFYLKDYLYNYHVVLNRPKDDEATASPIVYSTITDEKLFRLEYDPVRGKKNIDELFINGEEISSELNSTLKDTSAITKITDGEVIIDEFSNNNISGFDKTILRKTFFSSLNSCGNELVASIIKLLDESIEYIKYENDLVKFKRFDEDEMIMTDKELTLILSAGTFRGVELYIRGINALKKGKTLVVDEIENCFPKTLVFNLINIFNDEKINKKNAKLIFSTHYIEILDYLDRRDGIFITHKEKGIINIKNLYQDYDVRTELSKSKQFDNNVFDTAINYKQLLEVRRKLVNELYPNND